MIMSIPDNCFFSCFTPKGAEEIKRGIKERTYRDQEVIFEDNASADGVYLVLEGEVQLNKKVDGKGHVPIHVVKTGDYFGEVGVLDEKNRSAGAVSMGTSRIGCVPNETVRTILKSEPLDSTLKLFERILQYLRNSNDKFVHEVVRKEKLQLIGEMAGMIIHDFKNPITAIQLSAEILGTKHHDAFTIRKCEAIVHQSQRMVTMVQELLDFAKGNLAIETEPVPVSILFEKFRELNQDIFQHAEVDVSTEPIETCVKVNVPRMMRVFQNICMNAMDAMSTTGRRGSLKLSAKETGESVEVFISDNGPGIPDSIRTTIFEPFVTHGKKTGTGLGMAIVKMIVNAHQGEISFTSQKDQGTTFKIVLPKGV